MIRLALAGVRFRVVASLATFAAVSLGCSLLVACAGVFESAVRLDAPAQRFGAAAVVVAGSAGFRLPDEESETVPYTERSRLDANVAEKLSAFPGVERVVPDVSFPAAVVAKGRLLGGAGSGHGWESAALTPYTLSLGQQPQAAGQVVLDGALARGTGKAPGDRVTVMVGGRPETFVVSGVALPHHRVDAPALFFSATDVRRFSRHSGTYDVIGVFPVRGVSPQELARRLDNQRWPHLTILTGNDRGHAEFTAIAAGRLPMILLSGIFGGLVIVVMALVVSATIGLGIRGRLREIALLRAGGATPRQVHRMVVAETMIVSVLAALAGALPGVLLGRVIFALSVEYGVIPPELEFHPSTITFAAGLLLALLIPWPAAAIAAVTAARVRPIQALADAAIPPVTVGPTRRLLGVVLAGVTVVLATTTMFFDPETASAVGGPAVLTGGIAVALLGPEVLTWLLARTGGFITRAGGSANELAIINVRARAGQFASLLTPLTLATAIALGNIYAQTTHDDAVLQGRLEQFRADAMITSAAGVSGGFLEQIRQSPGVAHASALVSSRGWIEQPYDSRGSDPGTLLGIAAQDTASILATPLVSGSLRNLAGNTVALSEAQAAELEIELGERIRLRLGDGAAIDVKVIALLGSSADYGSVILPVDVLAAHTTTGLASAVLVRAAANQDVSTMVSALKRTSQAWPGATVGDQSRLSYIFPDAGGVQAWIGYLLAALAIAYATIAAVNALAVLVVSRRREFALQRLAGATPRQIRRMLLVESTIVAMAGIALGALIAVFTVFPMAVAVGSIMPTGPFWVILAVIATTVLTVAATTLATSRLALRPRPMNVINSPGGG